MFKGLFAAMFSAGVGFAVTALPACAADDIATKVQICAACHGENGVPTDPKTIPIIWGQQQQSYLVGLTATTFRSGDRAGDSPIMSPIAKDLAQDDLSQDRAIYFAAKKLTGRRNLPPPRPRHRADWPSASHAISRILREVLRRRGWPGSATTIWSQRCAPSPPASGPIISTCRNSCRRCPTANARPWRAICPRCDMRGPQHFGNFTT